MLDRSDRLQLVSLTDEEIADLVRAVPGLAACWARSANIDVEWLEVGKLPALAALRSVMVRQNDQLVAALARLVLRPSWLRWIQPNSIRMPVKDPMSSRRRPEEYSVPLRRSCFFLRSRREAIRSPERSPGASASFRFLRLATARTVT
jgi:hypothetical protein